MRPTLKQLEDPNHELKTLDFDQTDAPWSEETDWWREQDAELEAEELAEIEAQAELFEIARWGYE